MTGSATASIAAAASRVLAAAWAGSLWTVGLLVAPIVFAVIDDRRTAGDVAGRLFAAAGLVGLGCGAALLALSAWRGQLRGRFAAIASLLLALTALQQFAIQPRAAALRAGAGGEPPSAEARAAFGRWHATSSAIYLVQALSGLALVIASPMPAAGRRAA